MMIRSARSIGLTVLIRIRDQILRRSIDKKTAAPSPVAENREFHAQVKEWQPDTVKASEAQPEIEQDSSLQVKAINIGSSCIVLLYYMN